MLLSVILTTKKFYETLPLAGLVLSPSVLWLSIATVLVHSIWKLNRVVADFPSYLPSKEEGPLSRWRLPLLKWSCCCYCICLLIISLNDDSTDSLFCFKLQIYKYTKNKLKWLQQQQQQQLHHPIKNFSVSLQKFHFLFSEVFDGLLLLLLLLLLLFK